MKTYGLASILFATALVSTSLVGKAAELKEFHHRLMMPSPHATTNSLVIVATDPSMVIMPRSRAGRRFGLILCQPQHSLNDGIVGTAKRHAILIDVAPND